MGKSAACKCAFELANETDERNSSEACGAASFETREPVLVNAPSSRFTLSHDSSDGQNPFLMVSLPTAETHQHYEAERLTGLVCPH